MIRASIAVTISAVALALAGCSVAEPQGQQTDESQFANEPLENSIPCNLGETYDIATASTRANYEAPVDADYYLERYGAWVANESCTDSEVLAWQELRRTAGESDEICRVVYEYDATVGLVYPTGCAVPVLVVADASR